MEVHEWYDNYYCDKCKKYVHENHNLPKHDCKPPTQSTQKRGLIIRIIMKLCGVSKIPNGTSDNPDIRGNKNG